MSILVGVDCGTQGTKVIIVDTSTACVLAECSSAHKLISESNGCREQDPQWWIDAFISAYTQALHKAHIDAKEIDAIGISGQQHGLVVLDANAQVIRNAKLWCDTETATENAELLTLIGGEKTAIDKLGLRIETGYTASKILWLKKYEPENFKKIAHILLPHDYLNYWLTGQFSTDYGDASGTGLFDIHHRCWNREVCALIDPSGQLFDSLPKLNQAQDSAGIVVGKVKKLLGLRDDVLVSSGGGDNMMGAIGTGNVKNGIVTMSLGTSGTIYTFSDTPLASQHPSIANFCSSSNGWLPLICTMNVTSATTLVQQLLEVDLCEFNRLLSTSHIGANNISFLPFFNGERVPALPHGQGSLHGLNVSNFNRSNLVRSVVEGATYGLRYGLDLFRDAGIKVDHIRLIGGGAKSAPWRQIIADTMNAEVICPKNSEAGALGAAIQAYWVLIGAVDHQIIDDLVSLDEDSRTVPIASNVSLNNVAYHRYLETLYTQYPELVEEK